MDLNVEMNAFLIKTNKNALPLNNAQWFLIILLVMIVKKFIIIMNSKIFPLDLYVLILLNLMTTLNNLNLTIKIKIMLLFLIIIKIITYILLNDIFIIYFIIHIN